MKSNQVNIGDSILSSQYNNLRKDAYGGSMLLAREQGTPNMTLYVEAGVCYVGATRVIFAGGNSPIFTAPITNPRIDILTIDSAGILAITQGTEAASPTAPAYPSDKLVLCEVYNRVGETSIKDASDGTNGYIYNDVRPFLGGAYIASDGQVDANAAIQISKIRKNSTVLPETDNLYNLGSSTFQWAELRAKKLYKDNIEVGSKFGGDGSDGALSITTGTTTLDLGGAKIFIKNYTSISITGNGKLTFINPHSEGTLIILKSQDVILTSTINPLIDLTSLGGIGGGGGGEYAGRGGGWYGVGGLGGVGRTIGGTGQSGGVGGGGGGNSVSGNSGNVGGESRQKDISLGWGGSAAPALNGRVLMICPGGGGGGGSQGVNGAGGGISGGAGGRGAGALLIECGGALNFTGTINTNGNNGSSGSDGIDPGDGGGSGGGGAGGSVMILYNTLTANTGTITITGGLGGASVDGGGAGGNGATGQSLVAQNKDI